jgi:hypothetical protein
MTAKMNLKIYQGSTFQQTLRWESSERVYMPITAITKTAPVTITVPAHNIPQSWRVKFTDIVGTKELNSSTVYHQCTVLDQDTISINAINALGYTAYVSGGVVEYNKPVDLTGMTARMQIRARVDSTTVLHELTTENGGIVLDNTAKTIKLIIPATITASLAFIQAVYNLEVIDAQNIVTNFASGSVGAVKEVTR